MTRYLLTSGTLCVNQQAKELSRMEDSYKHVIRSAKFKAAQDCSGEVFIFLGAFKEGDVSSVCSICVPVYC